MNQVKEPVKDLPFDPAWDMKSLANMGIGNINPQFQLVFQFVIVGGSSYGGYMGSRDMEGITLKRIKDLTPVGVQPGLSVRVPYLSKRKGFAIKKGDLVFREQHTVLDY